MYIKTTLILFFLLAVLNVSAQKKLRGHFDPVKRQFISADTGILIGQFAGAYAPFMIKGKNPFIQKSNRTGFIDTAGKITIAPVYNNCSNFNGSLALASDTIGNFGVINKNGGVVIPFERQYIAMCTNGLLMVSTDSGVSFVDTLGRMVVAAGTYTRYATPPPVVREEGEDYGRSEFYWRQLDFTATVYFNKFIGVFRDGKWGVVNRAGKEIVPPKFDWMGIFNDSIAPVRQAGRYGATDAGGNIIVDAKYDNAETISPDLIRVTLDKKVGMMSRSHNVMLPVKYFFAAPIKNSRFLVAQNNGFGVVDEKDSVLIPLKNNEIKSFGSGYIVNEKYQATALFDENGKQLTDFFSDAAYFRDNSIYWSMGRDRGSLVYNQKSREYVHYSYMNGLLCCRDDLWGMLDTTGAEVIAPQYDRLWYLAPGALAAKQNNKWGVISTKGKVIYQFEFDDINGRIIRSDLAALIKVVKNKKVGLLDQNLRLVQALSYDAIDYNEYWSEYGGGPGRKLTARIGDKKGLLNLDGTIFTPVKYDAIGQFQNYLCKVYLGKKVGLIDTSGKEILECKYADFNVDTPLISIKQDSLYGLVNRRGRFIRPMVYENITKVGQQYDYRNAWYLLKYKGKTGLADSAANLVIPFIYDGLELTRYGYIIAKNNGLYGTIDRTGKKVIPCIYSKLFDLKAWGFDTRDVLYLVTCNGKMGIINAGGKAIIPCIYDNLKVSWTSPIPAQKNGRYGIIDLGGKTLTPFIYDDIALTTNYMTALNGKKGMLNRVGKQILAPVYDKVDGPFGHIYLCFKNNRVNLISDQGVLVAETPYDYIGFFSTDQFIVKLDDKWGLIDGKGKEIYPCIYRRITYEGGKIVAEIF